MDNIPIIEPKYDNKQGALAETYGMFVPETNNTASQISIDRITDKSLQSNWFYTSNVPFGTKREGKLLLGISLTPSAFEVVYGNNTKETCQSLIDTGYIKLNKLQEKLILALEKKGEVVFVDSNDMGLKGNDDEYRSFPIRTDKYDKDITIARMLWASAGYGLGYMLGRVMDNLRTNGGISEITIYTMNPEHVAENIDDGEIVARTSGLDYFRYSSIFDADYRGVDGHGALRGVLLDKSAEGGEKIRPLETLVGKGSVAHDNIAVVKQSDVSPQD